MSAWLKRSGSSICGMWPRPGSMAAASRRSRHAAAARKPSATSPTASTSVARTIPAMRRPRIIERPSRLLEVDALVHGQALQLAPQAIEPHLAGAEPHPLATAEDPAAPGVDALRGGDR